MLALVSVEGHPLMLEVGVHNFDAARFSFKEMADSTSHYLFIGSLHRIYLPAGSIALIQDGGRGQLIEKPGVHVFDSTTFEFKGIKPATTPFMQVGEAARVLVTAGTVANINIGGVPQQLPPGVHEFTETQNLEYQGSRAQSQSCVIS